ncbi:MAG: porin family protein [Flavobacteriaceae bacterium]
MKKFIVFSLFIFLSFQMSAQGRVDYLPNFDKKSFHWGYYLGLNQLSFDYVSNDEYLPSSGTSLGFNVGLIGDFRMTENLNFRVEPGLMTSGEKGFIEGPVWNSTYLHLPFLLKISTDRLKNIRPFIIGGASYDFNFKTTPDDLAHAGYEIHKNQFMTEFGIGVDIYLHYFKCSPSIRGIYSLTDELDRVGPSAVAYDKFRTSGVYFNLTFE